MNSHRKFNEREKKIRIFASFSQRHTHILISTSLFFAYFMFIVVVVEIKHKATAIHMVLEIIG